MMLAPWVWSLITVFFLLGIKLYRPAKSTLPLILMTWSCSILIVSSVLYLDGLMEKSSAFSWEPAVLSLGTFVFCFSLYNRYAKNKNNGNEKQKDKKSKARAC